MSRALAFLFPALLGAAQLTVDHATVAGTNLAEMRAKLASAGLQCEYGGRHNNHATEMAITSFPDGSYLELIALQSDADAKAVAAHEWAKQMQNNTGPCAWASRATDLAAELARLRQNGIDVGVAARNGRARPDGVKLDWETARVGREPNGTFFPFLIHDFTPRDLRAFPGGKPTTQEFSGIIKIVIAVRDLDAAAARYAKAYGASVKARETDTSFGARLALVSGTPVVLAAPLDDNHWLSRRLNQIGEGPCAFILGASSNARRKPASQSHWFGATIGWFDLEKLGWRLGYE